MILIARSKITLPGSVRVIRGGGWSSIGRICRPAYRRGHKPTFWNDFLGFRIAMRKDLPCDNTR